jgi:type II secretory pathway pseudopilin PulG
MNTSFKSIKRQVGLTLIELIAALGIGALVMVGALALYNNASSTQAATQLTSDLTAIKASVKQLFAGQGGYGAVSLNSTLIAANKIPTTMSISGSTITHQMNGTLTVAGNTATFDTTIASIPTAICVNIVTGTSGYTQIKVGANAARTTVPFSPANAATDCSAAATQTLVLSSS